MPPPLDPQLRKAILADIRAGEKSARTIARQHGVAQSTVSKIAKDVPDAFDRTQTKRATEARQIDLKALRVVTSRRFLEETNAALDRLHEPYRVHAFGGKDNTFNDELLDLPPAGEFRNFMTAAAVAFDKHLAADRHDNDDQGLAAVDAWLRTMLGT